MVPTKWRVQKQELFLIEVIWFPKRCSKYEKIASNSFTFAFWESDNIDMEGMAIDNGMAQAHPKP